MEKLLVTGGARSGKSTFAENWVRDLPDSGPVTYVATARAMPGDPEWTERVRRHRQRRPDSWRTHETTEVARLLRHATGTVLVECLSLWLTAVLDDVGAWDDANREDGNGSEAVAAAEAAIDELVDAWRRSPARVVAVTNEVGSGIVPATSSGRLFRDLLGTLNQRLAVEADRAVLCVAGRALDLPPALTPRATGTRRSHASSRPGAPAAVDHDAEQRTRELVDGLAKPPGSLGRLEEIGIWLAGRQGACPPRPPSQVGVTVIAGDHGVAADTSAYPPAITAAMVRTACRGRAAVNALAAEHGATVRVRDLGVDADLPDVPRNVLAHKIRRGTGRIDVEDAMTAEETRAAVHAGRILATEEVTGGSSQPDLLIVADLGIGNTTAAAALTGVVVGHRAEKVTGRGTGIDDSTLLRKTQIVQAAIERARQVRDDPVALLATIGGPDLAAMAGFLAAAAEHGVPMLLDGVVVTAAALVAELMTPGAAEWWLAGHRSVEPAHAAALDHLGMEPVVDLRMRLGEGTGALAALPTLRSAVAICTRMASLADLDLG